MCIINVRHNSSRHMFSYPWAILKGCMSSPFHYYLAKVQSLQRHCGWTLRFQPPVSIVDLVASAQKRKKNSHSGEQRNTPSATNLTLFEVLLSITFPALAIAAQKQPCPQHDQLHFHIPASFIPCSRPAPLTSKVRTFSCCAEVMYLCSSHTIELSSRSCRVANLLRNRL